MQLSPRFSKPFALCPQPNLLLCSRIIKRPFLEIGKYSPDITGRTCFFSRGDLFFPLPGRLESTEIEEGGSRGETVRADDRAQEMERARSVGSPPM